MDLAVVPRQDYVEVMLLEIDDRGDVASTLWPQGDHGGEHAQSGLDVVGPDPQRHWFLQHITILLQHLLHRQKHSGSQVREVLCYPG